LYNPCSYSFKAAVSFIIPLESIHKHRLTMTHTKTTDNRQDLRYFPSLFHRVYPLITYMLKKPIIVIGQLYPRKTWPTHGK
jgi:hypothetical protein